jgi:eukaryotic-like serine/threonine-protein kinase
LVSEIRDKWIWPFELLEKIGEGGMGVVYRARYVNNDKEVALKLLADTVTDPIILGRFDRELEILRKLRHPNIVYCFGGATEGKYRYYAMEIVDGGSLDGLISRRGSLPWELVVKYARQMCSALDCAHSHGVTHRDVKPGNFLIASNGQLKLSDFGLATFVSAQNLTASGKTMGTFRYMSPEQIRGKDVGPQSDLYSLGCVMFEMLTGQPVFDGKSPAEILDLHLNHPPARASSIALDCPALLDKLISRLLEKDPAKRPESASGVAGGGFADRGGQNSLDPDRPNLDRVQADDAQGRVLALENACLAGDLYHVGAVLSRRGLDNVPLGALSGWERHGRTGRRLERATSGGQNLRRAGAGTAGDP